MWTLNDMPKRRSDCLKRKRPCPWVRCKYHLIWLLWDKLSDKPNDEIADYVTEMECSCVLDAIDTYGEMTLEQIGQLLRVTRERIRQIEGKAIGRARKPTKERALILEDLRDNLTRSGSTRSPAVLSRDRFRRILLFDPSLD